MYKSSYSAHTDFFILGTLLKAVLLLFELFLFRLKRYTRIFYVKRNEVLEKIKN